MITVKLDTREFSSALKAYYAQSQRDLAYCVNRQALNVVIKTLKRTPKSSREKILADLGVTGTKLKAVTRGKNAGKLRAAGRIFGGVTIYKLVNFYRAKAGLPAARRAEMAGLANKFANRRSGSVGYLRSGWIPALKKLAALKLKLRANSSDTLEARRIKRPPGNAKPAGPGFNPTAEIVNFAKGVAQGAPALQQGINDAAADMRQFVAEQMGETAKKFNAR